MNDRDELIAIADDLAQVPHPMAEEVLVSLMEFIKQREVNDG